MHYLIAGCLFALFILCRIDAQAMDLVLFFVWDLPNAMIDVLMEVYYELV